MSNKSLGDLESALIKALPSAGAQLLARDYFLALNKEFQKRDKEIAALREELESLKAS